MRPYRNAEGQPGSIVFIRDTAALAGNNQQLLCEAFGLTGAEAGLAIALSKGMSLNLYAQLQNLSINTVYTHYRRLKDKTGVTTQTALIVILKNMILPVN